VKRFFRPEAVVLAMIVFVGLWLGAGHGVGGFVLLVVLCGVLGGVVGALGNRYPMIYHQNRRDRRRHRDSTAAKGTKRIY
jgi:hypothetical protein